MASTELPGYADDRDAETNTPVTLSTSQLRFLRRLDV
jgi:hypothetical protein